MARNTTPHTHCEVIASDSLSAGIVSDSSTAAPRVACSMRGARPASTAAAVWSLTTSAAAGGSMTTGAITTAGSTAGGGVKSTTVHARAHHDAVSGAITQDRIAKMFNQKEGFTIKFDGTETSLIDQIHPNYMQT